MAQKTITAAPAKAQKNAVGPGKLSRIVIEFKANGFEVEKCFSPKVGKNGPIWMGDQPKDSMVFTQPGELLDYLEKCLPASEHAAHEKNERTRKGSGAGEYR